ncbi:hypothetical protein R5R35_005039 [Gryllus longicercus]|uniref:Uncharacterized protein n=1 Tax=Gryllus longicercus TaxID=2509291 RepID=A0AAN9VUN0_9ORTH
MTSRSSLGEELVENFQLLLQFYPNDDCASVVKENMLSLPDKRTFQNVMKFVFDILKPSWRSEISSRFITPQDERQFNNMLCDHFKALRKVISKPCELKPDEEIDKDILQEFNDLTKECDNLRKQIQQKREENEQAVAHQMEILQLVVSAGYWNEDIKRRFLDISDKNIIAEMIKKKDNSLNELKYLKEKLQPYFVHVYHIYNKVDCACQPVFNLPDEKVSKISDFLCEVDRNRICVDIMQLKLISAVKILKIKYAKSIDPNVQFDEHVPSALIEKLEELVSADVDENTSVDINTLLGSSPLVVDMNSPADDASLGFTPITHVTPIARDWMKLKKKPVKMDLESLAECVVPAKVCASPVRIIPTQIVSDQFEKPKSNETIMAVVERMRSRMAETPSKFATHRFNSSDLKTSFPSFCSTTGPPLHYPMSALKFENSTPVSKSQVPILSRTTGRRQSMGFAKPANCLVRRQLACTPLTKMKPPTTSGKPKSVTGTNEDKILDKLVQQLVEDKNNESFDSDSLADDLDLSLSGVERIQYPCAGNEFPIQINSNHETGLSSTQAEHTAPLLEHPILSEVIEDDRELSALINSICEDECPNSQDLDEKEQLDIFLSDKEISKIYDSQQKSQRKPEVAKKSGRPSLDLLIERFNAIKKGQQQK